MRILQSEPAGADTQPACLGAGLAWAQDRAAYVVWLILRASWRSYTLAVMLRDLWRKRHAPLAA
jgi:hypothetical protein